MRALKNREVVLMVACALVLALVISVLTFMSYRLKTGSVRIKRTRVAASVKSMDVSADGELVVTGDENGSIKVWRKNSLALIKSIPGHHRRANQVLLSPDAKYIVSSSSLERDINVWELPSGRLAHTYRFDSKRSQQKFFFNKKGTLLIVSDGREIFGIPFKIGKERSLETKSNAKWSLDVSGGKDMGVLALSPNKKVLAAASFGKGDSVSSIRLWRCPRGKWNTETDFHEMAPINLPKKPEDTINNMCFTKDGKHLLVASFHGVISIYDLDQRSPQLAKMIDTKASQIWSLAVTDDNGTIITTYDRDIASGETGVIHTWDVKTGTRTKEIRKLGNGPVVALQGSSLVIGTNWGLWVTNTQLQLLASRGLRSNAVSTLLLTRSNDTMVSAGWDNSIVNIWDIPAFTCRKSIDTGHWCDSAAITPDDKLLVFGSSDGTVAIIDLQSGNILREIKVYTKRIPGRGNIFISSDGKYFVYQKQNMSKAFRISDGEEVANSLTGNFPKGEVIAQFGEDYIIKMDDTEYAIAIRGSDGRDAVNINFGQNFRGRMKNIVLSPDRKYLFMAEWKGSGTGILNQFDLSTGARIKSIETDSCCVLGGNVKYLVSGGENKIASIWDIDTGEKIGQLTGHQDEIMAIKIIGNVAVTAGNDGQMLVWSLPQGQLSTTLQHEWMGHGTSLDLVQDE